MTAFSLAPRRRDYRRHAQQHQSHAHHAQCLSAGASRSSGRERRISTRSRSACSSLKRNRSRQARRSKRRRGFSPSLRRSISAPQMGALYRSHRCALQLPSSRSPIPTSQAVMFCLMDVSGSMGEREKDLAKRFYILLHLFLKRRYERVELVFIRHTHLAQEVDEETFFYSRQSGGTIVSTALEEMLQDLEGALLHRGMECLCGAGFRRLHASGRCAALRRALERRDHAALPILRLYRDSRRARDGSVRRRGGRRRALALLSHGAAERGAISPPSASPSPAISSRCSASCLRARTEAAQ